MKNGIVAAQLSQNDEADTNGKKSSDKGPRGKTRREIAASRGSLRRHWRDQLALTFGAAGQVCRYRFLFVNSNGAGVRANESTTDETTGKFLEMILFNRLEVKEADFCGGRNSFQANPPPFPFLP